MNAEFDKAHLICYALREGYLPDRVTAEQALTGLLQWLACHDHATRIAFPHVMLEGPVHDLWSAFIFNTALYAQFCQRYVGSFVHHIPVVHSVQNEHIHNIGWYTATIFELRTVFKETLAYQLSLWDSKSRPAVKSVSILPHEVYAYQSFVQLGMYPEMSEKTFSKNYKGSRQ